MIKLTLKTASLLLMALFSISVWANSPFAEVEEEAAAASQNGSDMDTQQVSDSPFASEELAQPSPAEQTQTIETQQTGDVLSVPQSTQTQQPIAVRFLEFPRRGMNTDKVINELGQPGEILPAIGQPPITRWVYDDRIVYFEYSSVIHVVAR